jgi:hypothetical protein
MTYFSDSEFEPPKQKSAAEDRNSFDLDNNGKQNSRYAAAIDCDKANDVHAWWVVGRATDADIYQRYHLPAVPSHRKKETCKL